MEKKTIVLMVSKFFPAYHPRAGQETGFADNILSGVKLHTIRKNYELWKERADEINSGKAVLSLRQWEGKAYRSKQEEFHRLEKIKVQKVEFPDYLYNVYKDFVLTCTKTAPRKIQLRQISAS